MFDIKIGSDGPSGRTITIVDKETKNSYPRFIYLSTDTSNCKLSYIHSSGTLASLKDEALKEIFDETLKNAKGCIILNTTQRRIFDFIKSTYPVYYKHLVPIGYGGDYQYHICFKNTIKVNSVCRDPKKDEPVLNKTNIKDKLHAILKSRRRKNDYVDEFIDSL